jgi:hypothetical protein
MEHLAKPPSPEINLRAEVWPNGQEAKPFGLFLGPRRGLYPLVVRPGLSYFSSNSG